MNKGFPKKIIRFKNRAKIQKIYLQAINQMLFLRLRGKQLIQWLLSHYTLLFYLQIKAQKKGSPIKATPLKRLSMAI